jgi:arylsulfatase A-like enzyme
MHVIMGHAYTVYLEETGVPLVILSRAAPAARRVESFVSLRDLPATVVDLLGLSAGSPFPGPLARRILETGAR